MEINKFCKIYFHDLIVSWMCAKIITKARSNNTTVLFLITFYKQYRCRREYGNSNHSRRRKRT